MEGVWDFVMWLFHYDDVQLIIVTGVFILVIWLGIKDAGQDEVRGYNFWEDD